MACRVSRSGVGRSEPDPDFRNYASEDLILPSDSKQLRDDLSAFLPSLRTDALLAESGQRVVYLAHFEDSLIPPDIRNSASENNDNSDFLVGWESWGKVVVKVVSGADPQTLARLQAEVAILEDVRPSSFPRLLYSNLFTENPLTDNRIPEPLYVTVEEFIDSLSLDEFFSEFTGNEKKVINLALDIANALTPLWHHPKRFVHRDIKPANILVRRTGEILVIDLGIARETGSKGLTENGWGMAPFTVGYAAPEQIANDKVSISFKTDFFSIGVLMYRLISGKEAFQPNPGMGAHEIIMSTQSYEPPPLSDIAGSSKGISDFVTKAMDKDPFRRHRTPGLFIEELKMLQAA